jgi:hypothetical protein
MSEPNGTVTEKKESALDKLHKEWVANGSKLPDVKTVKALMADYLKANKARTDAEKVFLAAREAESACAVSVIKARGKGRFKGPNGVQYTAMSKGESVFLRVDGGEDLPSFG